MPPSSLKVLVVDDNEDSASITAELLRLYNYNVETANSGYAGIEVAKDFLPDVILLDLGMPDIDGIEVLKSLKKFHHLAKTKFIAYTGYSTGQPYRDAIVNGFDKVIHKPAQIQEIIAAINEEN